MIRSRWERGYRGDIGSFLPLPPSNERVVMPDTFPYLDPDYDDTPNYSDTFPPVPAITFKWWQWGEMKRLYCRYNETVGNGDVMMQGFQWDRFWNYVNAITRNAPNKRVVQDEVIASIRADVLGWQ